MKFIQKNTQNIYIKSLQLTKGFNFVFSGLHFQIIIPSTSRSSSIKMINIVLT